ncbi:MAG: hypothetical protein AAF432_00595 [Planctomycetota bacterium]
MIALTALNSLILLGGLLTVSAIVVGLMKWASVDNEDATEDGS